MTQIKKAIIPAAGLGTRFLPATKTVPKELLTIVDAPIILYVVEEAVSAGIEDVVLIAGRGKTAIEDFFDFSYELEDKLLKDGKKDFLDRVLNVRNKVNIISIRQKQPLGLGHAVLCGQPVVGREPFAVLLGDEIMIPVPEEKSVTGRLSQAYSKSGKSTVAVMKVLDSEVSKYGIVGVETISDSLASGSLFKVTKVVEKPSLQAAPSRWALPGRYVFDSKIFDYIKETKTGVSGEIQLTDAMQKLADIEGLDAITFKSERFDAGDKLGYLQANVELSLRREDLSAKMRNYILDLAKRL